MRASTIEIGDRKVETTNARDLHAQMHVNMRTTRWFTRRVDRHEFVEGLGYVTSTMRASHGSGLTVPDPWLTVDAVRRIVGETGALPSDEVTAWL